MEDIFAKLGDKAVGLVTYLVLALDLLGLRTVIGKAIATVGTAVRESAEQLREAVGRVISRQLGHFMYWYAGALGAVMVIASMLRFLTWDGKGSQPLWSYILFVAVTIGVMAWIIWSARNQIRWGDGNVLYWQDLRNNNQYTRNDGGLWYVRRGGQGDWTRLTRRPNLDKAMPFYGANHHPLRVSFYRSGVQLMTATAIMGIALFVDTMALELKWLILPEFLLFLVGVLVVRVVTAVAAWTVVNASRLMEVAGEQAAQPLAALPELTTEDLKDQLFSGGRLNLFDEEKGSEGLRHIYEFAIRAIGPYLILVFVAGANQGWSLGIGIVLGVSQATSWFYSSDRNPDAADEVVAQRRKFLRAVWQWSPWLAAMSAIGDKLMEYFLGTSVGIWYTRVTSGQVNLVGNHSLWYLIPAVLILFPATAYMIQQAKETSWPKKWKALGIAVPAVLLAYAMLAIPVRIDGEEGWTPFTRLQTAMHWQGGIALPPPSPAGVSNPPAPQGAGARGQTPVVQHPRRVPRRYAACQGQCGASYQKSRQDVKDRLARRRGVE